jgi:hypothetical protein
MTKQRAAGFAAVLAALAAVYALPAAAADPPARIVAIGDVHGAYDEFVALLRAAGLVDAQLDWRGGDARLVVLGDVLDRGAESRRALELIIRLREQAPLSGGEAELVLGNHEVMNLLGDLAYVTPAEYAAYGSDESPQDREAAWQRFRAGSDGETGDALAAQFAARYPPGFFGHRAAFSPRGSLGAWLLARPVLATIDRTAFVHGGLPAAIDGKAAAEINREHNDALREYLAAVEQLTDAGALHPEDAFHEQPAIAARFVAAQGAAVAESVRRAAERVQALALSPAFGSNAVFWYRGTASCSAAIERARLESELRVLGVDRVVIGHTPTPNARALSRFDAAVIRADTGMLASYYGGRPAAIVIRGDEVRALYADAAEEAALQPQPRTVGRGVRGLDDDGLEQLLAQAPVMTRARRADGSEDLQLDRRGELVAAVFRPAPRRGRAVLPEVAAYRLDRLLELDLIPVAVRREIDGRVGTVQLDTDELPNEQQRSSRPSTTEPWCPLREQFNLMYVLDALAHNEGRSAASMRYVPPSWQLVLTDNRRMFEIHRGLPVYLRTVAIEVPGGLAERLETLTEELLAQRLGDVLDERQRTAILARRDNLLAR